MIRFAVSVIAALILVGCASQPPARQGETADTAAQTHSSPVDLVNLWRVTGAAGESAGTWLRIDAQEFHLWRECGTTSGAWSAIDGKFIGTVYSMTDACAVDGFPAIDWMDDVTGYVASSGGFDLIGADGTTVASLAVDGAPEPMPGVDEALTEPPLVTDEVRARLLPPSPVPASSTAATPDRLLGNWIPVGYEPPAEPRGNFTDAGVTFSADGTWSASDGCNVSTSRWALGDGGELLTGTFVMTQIGCDNVPVPSWVGGASTAGFSADGTLLLFDAKSVEIGRLVPA